MKSSKGGSVASVSVNVQDAPSNSNKKDFYPTRVYAFVVNNTNEDLTRFAEATGGVGISNL